MRGVVLDLRGNGGGSLEEAISLTGLFIRQGPGGADARPDGRDRGGRGHRSRRSIRRAAGRADQPVQRFRVGDPGRRLQDYGRAVVVGDSSTFGKGTVQSISAARDR